MNTAAPDPSADAVVWMVRDRVTKKLWLDENAVWEEREDAEMCASDMNEEIEDANFEAVAMSPAAPAAAVGGNRE